MFRSPDIPTADVRPDVVSMILMAVPLTVFGLVLWMTFAPKGSFGEIRFLDWTLVFGRVDALTLVFAHIMSLMCCIGTLYGLHVKEDGQHMAAWTYAAGSLGARRSMARRNSDSMVNRSVLRERMAGVPILNPALSVQTVDFSPWRGHWLGALVTPWFINLVVMPLDPAAWRSAPERWPRCWSCSSAPYGARRRGSSEA